MEHIDNFVLINENAVYYECSYSCDNLIYLKIGSESYFITDSRYEIEANLYAKVSKIVISNDLIKSAKKILKNSKIKKIVFDPYDFNVALFNDLSTKLDIKFIQKTNFSKLKRIIKTDEEIDLLKHAMQIGRDGFDKFKVFLHEHGYEKNEKYLNFKAIELMTQHGRYNLSFDPIIAVNENAAKPHALPTSKKFFQNDLLLMDAGIKYKRYCSDRTITYMSKGNDLQKKVYNIVLEAQEKAIMKAKVGMKASKIDAIAREVIEKYGYGKYFVHSTGHGVGLDIHEYPNISRKSDVVIEENMVFTVEPGIYIPNEFGVRIEDTVAMINGKAEIL